MMSRRTFSCKRYTLLIFASIILVSISSNYSCNKHKKKTETSNFEKEIMDNTEEASSAESETQDVFNYKDSLLNYMYTDSIIINPFYPRVPVLYIANVNNIRTGVFINLKGYTSYLLFLQYDGNKWQLKDSLEYGMDYPYIRYYDLNGDKYTDIKIGGHSGNNGNSASMVFLYSPSIGSFTFNPHYCLENLKYYPALQRVTSYYFGDDDIGSIKYLYRVTGDSLNLEKSVECYKRELVYYTYANGKEIIRSKKKGDEEQIWEEFIHAYWYTPSHGDFEKYP